MNIEQITNLLTAKSDQAKVDGDLLTIHVCNAILQEIVRFLDQLGTWATTPEVFANGRPPTKVGGTLYDLHIIRREIVLEVLKLLYDEEQEL